MKRSRNSGKDVIYFTAIAVTVFHPHICFRSLLEFGLQQQCLPLLKKQKNTLECLGNTSFREQLGIALRKTLSKRVPVLLID